MAPSKSFRNIESQDDGDEIIIGNMEKLCLHVSNGINPNGWAGISKLTEQKPSVTLGRYDEKTIVGRYMDVTVETPEQTQVRLLRVLCSAEIEWLSGEYMYNEVDSPGLAAASVEEALAIIRDGDRWSMLQPASDHGQEKFCIFCCHFAAEIPNSGFVGWLASAFKKHLGTGVFVVCGQNLNRGGIFDYWGLPIEVREEAKRFLDQLRNSL